MLKGRPCGPDADFLEINVRHEVYVPDVNVRHAVMSGDVRITVRCDTSRFRPVYAAVPMCSSNLSTFLSGSNGSIRDEKDVKP